MHMLYNSDSYVVVQFELPAAPSAEGVDDAVPAAFATGGYEIVDKFLRKETFLAGAMAQSFRDGVDALIRTQPSEEEVDDYIERFASLMQQPVVLH